LIDLHKWCLTEAKNDATQKKLSTDRQWPGYRDPPKVAEQRHAVQAVVRMPGVEMGSNSEISVEHWKRIFRTAAKSFQELHDKGADASPSFVRFGTT
jgi:hypothetical protein